MYINLKQISEKTNIPEEKLERMSVKSIKTLQEKIEKAEAKIEQKKRLEDPFYAEVVRKMYRQYDICRMLFSDKEIIKTCAKFMSLEDLTEEHISRNTSHELRYRKGIFKEERVCRLKKLHGPGSRSGATENVRCSIFYVPNSYQYINGGSDVLEYLLQKKYGIKFKVYDITRPEEYIYVNIPTEDGAGRSLYVPFKYLVEKNKKEIEQSNIDYWKRYNRTDVSNFVNSQNVQDVLEKICK